MKGNNEEQRDNSRAPRKRLRSNEFDSMSSTDEETFSCHMLMLKAEALIHLHQPLEALQSLNRILKVLEGIQSPRYCSSHHDKETSEKQQRKRRRTETGESSLLMEQEPEIVSNELVRLKVRVYEQKASILEGLGQTHDALHQLHLSLECLPDNPGTVYKHTQLLLKLGSGNEAATNWLRFRGIQRHQKVDLGSIKQALSSSLVRLVDSEDVSLEQVQAMDEQILKWYRKSRNEAFLPFF